MWPDLRQVVRQDGHPEGPRKAGVLYATTVRGTREKQEPRDKVNRGRRRDVTEVRCFNCKTLRHYAADRPPT